jgi:hypothetical protein
MCVYNIDDIYACVYVCVCVCVCVCAHITIYIILRLCISCEVDNEGLPSLCLAYVIQSVC